MYLLFKCSNYQFRIGGGGGGMGESASVSVPNILIKVKDFHSTVFFRLTGLLHDKIDCTNNILYSGD